MPTALPFRPVRVRRLSWPETIRFLRLVAHLRWLDRRLHAAHARVDRLGLDMGGAALLRLAHRWLATHEAVAALLGIPEPPQVTQVRIALRRPRPAQPPPSLKG